MTVFSALRSDRLLGLLAGAAALLWVGVALVLIGNGYHDDLKPEVADRSVQDVQVNGPAVRPVISAPDTPNWRSKPLFEPERQVLVASSEPAAEPVEAAKPDMILTGVLMDGSRHFAVVHDQTSSQSAVLAPGDRFKGWRLEAISAQQANLSLGTRSLQLDLFADDGRARVGHSLTAAPQRPPEGSEGDSQEATEQPSQASF